jgi:CheY-like chemotaxis protein
VREIVARCGGWVEIHSRKGEGTALDLYFPRCQAEIPGDTATAAARWEHPQTIGTTILVVEDEEQVAHLTKKILERSGYQVLMANSPHKALAILEDHTVRIDLLLSDVMMPEMTGRELRDLAMTLRPSLRTLFMSGYTAETFSEQGILETGVPFLAKPFTIGSLLEKVRAALAS